MRRLPVRVLVFCLLAGCGTAAPEPDDVPTQRGLLTDQTLTVGGIERAFHLFLPDAPAGAPVVLLLHGHNSSHDELLGLSGAPAPYAVWLDVARREGLVLVVPNGRFVSEQEKGWNDCRADAPTNSRADDVAVVRALLDHVVQRYGADGRRVYATGSSNGGHFAIRLADEMPERLAAVAAVSASVAENSECASSSVPVPALFINGTADPLLPYGGGAMAGDRGEVWAVERTVAHWVARNGADPTPTVEPVPDAAVVDGSRAERLRYAGAREVWLLRVVEGGHPDPSPSQRYAARALAVLGSQNADVEMAEEAWAFFRGKQR